MGLYYEENKNRLGMNGCIDLDDLDLSDAESVDADGDVFTGSVKYTNGNSFEYVDSCS